MRKRVFSNSKLGICLVLVALSLPFFLNYRQNLSKDLILFDFESASELDRLNWKCHSLLSLTDQHVTHGNRALKMEIFPADYPGLVPKIEFNDWRGFAAICFDIYNLEKDNLIISVRIDDRKDSPEYSDRFNSSYSLRQGQNDLCIKFPLATSGTGRYLDLKNIHKFLIFMNHPIRKHVFYIDYIRLIKN